MLLFFASQALEQQCLVSRLAAAAWERRAASVHRRLCQLDAADSLAVLLELPVRLRPLPRRIASLTEFIWTVVPPLQIVFSAVADDGAPLDDAPRDPHMIKAVRILAIEENHGR